MFCLSPSPMTITEISAVSVAIVSSIGSIALAIMSFRKGTSDIDSKNIASLQTRVTLVEGEKEEVKRRLSVCEDKHAKNLEERGKLQGQLDTTLAILKDRNPETTKFMEYITKVASGSESFMTKADARDQQMIASLTSISGVLEQLNQHFAEKKTS